MPHLPVVSGRELVKFLGKLGYQVIRQKGSHVRLKKDTPSGTHYITIPSHKIIAKGTLNDILNRISQWNNITKEELIEKIRKMI
ncbi:type II toxin-antitoxin system HicA family toxin [bacterium]|nr:type II toxin-antitoxin system HicA family toxin [bacterium]